MYALSRWAPSRLTTRRLAPECVCPLRHHSLNSIPLQLYINSNIHSFDVILIKFGTDLLCQDAEFYGLRSSTVVFWLCQQRLVGIPFPRAVSSVCVFVCARACCILMWGKKSTIYTHTHTHTVWMRVCCLTRNQTNGGRSVVALGALEVKGGSTKYKIEKSIAIYLNGMLSKFGSLGTSQTCQSNTNVTFHSSRQAVTRVQHSMQVLQWIQINLHFVCYGNGRSAYSNQKQQQQPTTTRTSHRSYTEIINE